MFACVLVVDDEPTIASNVCKYLRRLGCEAHTAHSASEALNRFEAIRPELVLLDFWLPDGDGLELLQTLLGRDPAVNVIMVSGQDRIETAVQALKSGARDYLTKPLSLAQLKLSMERLAAQERLQARESFRNRQLAADNAIAALQGESEPMRALRAAVSRIVKSVPGLSSGEQPSVLISGETGTGKGLIARALHFGEAGNAAPFIELNCAAIPSQLLESELFGHERGAFTDARSRKSGLVEMAQGGTLFLDEIADLDIALQAKLLRLLEERHFRRVGGLRDLHADVRIVAATHQPLQQLVADGRFRMDLYYRLHVIELRAPALRERGADIECLAERFIDEFARRYRRPHPGLTGCARQALRSHPWPGNVRELRNRIEQAVLLCDGPDIDAAALALGGVLAGSARAERTLPAASPGGAVVATGTMPAGGGAMLGETGFAHSVALRMPAEGVTLNEMEQALVAEAMKRADGNITRAAALLGISRDQMRYRVDKLDPARRTEQG